MTRRPKSAGRGSRLRYSETLQVTGNYESETVDQLGPSVARHSQGEASDEQGKARGYEGNETSGNSIKATHDTSFGSKDDAAKDFIKSFGINGVPPLGNAEQHYQNTKQNYGANAGADKKARRNAIDCNHSDPQVEGYTFATDVLRTSANDAVEFLPAARDPFTIGDDCGWSLAVMAPRSSLH
jgi:hypothetical protein